MRALFGICFAVALGATASLHAAAAAPRPALSYDRVFDVAVPVTGIAGYVFGVPVPTEAIASPSTVELAYDAPSGFDALPIVAGLRFRYVPPVRFTANAGDVNLTLPALQLESAPAFANAPASLVPTNLGALNRLALEPRTAETPATEIISDPHLTDAYPFSNPFEASAPMLGISDAQLSSPQAISLQESSAPLRVRGVNLQGVVSAAHFQETASESFTTASSVGTDDRVTAGTLLNARVFRKPISLDLSGSFERLVRSDSFSQPYVPWNPSGTVDAAPLATLPGGPSAFSPNQVDLTSRSLNAAAAMPISRQVTVGVQYNTQFYSGTYTALDQDITARKDLYQGNVTYTIPRTSSAITFSAQAYRYHDALLPEDLLQNSANINFTVKF
ncbi:MAG: hypothetical protein JOZ38_08030 [Candidatus Eremiobacteraeota bacterium]|nr:hypothetical protein [Candidatus Eremiobacteraeota bacterium]